MSEFMTFIKDDFAVQNTIYSAHYHIHNNYTLEHYVFFYALQRAALARTMCVNENISDIQY